MSVRRSGAGVGVLDGILYAVGGHDGPLVRKSVEAYNPEAETWTQVADMAFCRRNAGMCVKLNFFPKMSYTFNYILSMHAYFLFQGVVALNGLLYVVGGDDGSANLASVEVYNPKTDSWSMLPSSMGIGRSYAGVAIIDKPM